MLVCFVTDYDGERAAGARSGHGSASHRTCAVRRGLACDDSGAGARVHSDSRGGDASDRDGEDAISKRKGKANDREQRKSKKRSLSNHVVSRYYRAPEIILLEKEYTQKVDMWSIGCIFAEMLHCLEPVNSHKLKEQNRILLPGNSCYPLSPDGNCDVVESQLDGVEGNDIHLSSRDQIKYICRTIGTP